MPFIEKLTGEYTPERVYSLCKLAYTKKYSSDELRELLYIPIVQDKGSDTFKNIYKFAQNADLIKENSDFTVSCTLNEDEIESLESFRKAMNKRIFNGYSRNFSKFTAWYIARGDKVTLEKAKQLEDEYKKEHKSNDYGSMYNDTNILAWREWAKFLGFGFVHDGILIPNIHLRLQDALDDIELEKNKPIAFREFLSELSKLCPEVDSGILFENNKGQSVIEPNNISFALSMGLRTLHDKQLIKLIYTKDSNDVWSLYTQNLHEIQKSISHIEIIG